jgi:hypothetical protein
MWGWGLISIAGIFGAIRLHHVLPAPMYLVVVMVTFDGIFCLICISKFSGGVCTESKEVLGKWKVVGLSYEKRKITRKFFRSCEPLKIKMGMCNYFDGTTPLVIMDFLVIQSVNLLLAD